MAASPQRQLSSLSRRCKFRRLVSAHRAPGARSSQSIGARHGAASPQRQLSSLSRGQHRVIMESLSGGLRGAADSTRARRWVQEIAAVEDLARHSCMQASAAPGCLCFGLTRPPEPGPEQRQDHRARGAGSGPLAVGGVATKNALVRHNSSRMAHLRVSSRGLACGLRGAAGSAELTGWLRTPRRQ